MVPEKFKIKIGKMRKYRGQESMKSKVLKFVEKLGSATFTQIQEFIVDTKFGKGTYQNAKGTDVSYRYKLDEKGNMETYTTRTNPYRGYYCGAFSQSIPNFLKPSEPGYFLRGDNRLEKGEDGKYRVIRNS